MLCRAKASSVSQVGLDAATDSVLFFPTGGVSFCSGVDAPAVRWANRRLHRRHSFTRLLTSPLQHDGLWVCGCVIKNYTTEIAAIRSAEVHTGRGKVERFETYEYLHLGIAVNSTTILGLKLSCGFAIRDHALRHGAQLR